MLNVFIIIKKRLLLVIWVNLAQENLQSFVDHFKNMSSTENESSFRENINNSEHHDIQHIDCLDSEITIDEVMKMLSSVAKN